MKWLKTILFFEVLLSPAFAGAQATVSITDSPAPPSMSGDLTGWPAKPAIVLDQKTQMVIGQSDWTGPDFFSGKVYMTYDKTNLYIAADIASKNPQFNSQNASNIYNGDAVELYVGTDLTNPARKSYAPTDVQVVISPGKAGDGAEIYSMTDKADIPGAKVATTATAVAAHYGAGLLDGWLVDERDKAATTAPELSGIAVRALPLYMTDLAATAQIAQAALDLAVELSR